MKKSRIVVIVLGTLGSVSLAAGTIIYAIRRHIKSA